MDPVKAAFRVTKAAVKQVNEQASEVGQTWAGLPVPRLSGMNKLPPSVPQFPHCGAVNETMHEKFCNSAWRYYYDGNYSNPSISGPHQLRILES